MDSPDNSHTIIRRLENALDTERARLREVEAELARKLTEVTQLNEQLVSHIAERNLELESERNRISRLLEIDDLTGVSNRRRFEDRMRALFDNAAIHGGQILLLKVDLDGLKGVNRRHGYETGDLLLKMAAARLQDSVREHDVVARLGDDNFAILCTSGRMRYSLDQLCERVQRALSQPFYCGDQKVHVSGSIGAAAAPASRTDPQSLYRKADLALERAKQRGGNCFVRYEAGMEGSGNEYENLSSDLRAAIRSGNIAVHFQPQVDSLSGRVTALEALARWPRPDGTLIAPKQFIALAEENGDIRDLGLEILRQTCRHSGDWLRSGLVQRVAVNVSPRQLDDADVIDRIREVLDTEDFDPSWLELEITEQTLVGSVRDAGFKLRTAHDLGMTIALDDFGTGYSNLNALKRLPFDVVKIDKSFIDSIEENGTDRIVVEAIIELARAFSLRTVAEGVETEGQAKLLNEIGCKELQGWLFAKAMSPEDCAAWLASNGSASGSRAAGATPAPNPMPS